MSLIDKLKKKKKKESTELEMDTSQKAKKEKHIKQYDEDSFKFHKHDVDKIRKRPSMYMGSTPIQQCAQEVVDNSVDEANETNQGSKTWNIYIKYELVKGKHTFLIADRGRGIPIGINKEIKMSTLTGAFTQLQGGGKFDAKSYEAGRGCFIGDTKIKLLNGKSTKISKLYEKFERTKKPFWVYSFDIDGTSHFVPRKCTKVHLTKYTKKLCEVTLDSGDIVTCTPDHPFLTFDGVYVEASKLVEGQRLRALYTKLDRDGYELHSHRKTYSNNPQSSHRTNRTVMKELGFKIKGKDVHHKNGNKLDNRPRNLEIEYRRSKEHFAKDRLLGKHAKFLNKPKELIELNRAIASRINKDYDIPLLAQKGKIVQASARALRDYGVVNAETYNACRGIGTAKSKTALCYFSWEEINKLAKRYLKKYGPEGRTENNGKGLNYTLQKDQNRYDTPNHYVESVKLVRLETKVPVYDLTVEGEHNYLLGCGVFVHNTNGTGVCATNALSEHLEVWSCREGSWYYQEFKFGHPVNKDVIKKDPDKKYAKNKCGTIVKFTVDNSIEQIACDEFSLERFKSWLNVISMVDSPIKILLEYETKKGTKSIEYFKPEGTIEYLKMKLEENKLEVFGKRPFVFANKLASCIFQWASTEEPMLDAFTNGIYNKDGGTHVAGFYSALVKAFNTVVNNKKKELKEADLRSGLVGLLNVRIPEAQYKDQVKNELNSPIKKEVEEAFKMPMIEFFTKHKSLVKEIQERAAALRDAKLKAKELMKAASKVKTKGQSLPSKLVMCESKCPVSERELFLLEGDSAGGPAKRARDKRYQMVLPLKGKPINVARCTIAKALGSIPVKEILTTVGFDAKSFAKYGKSVAPYNLGRVILTADADEDGRHIENLMLTVLYKFVPEVFEKEMVYLVDSPLYVARIKGKKRYAYTYKEAIKKFGPTAQLKRMKGWAEANDDELEHIAFKKETRKLFMIKPITASEGKKFLLIVGDDTSERKRILKIDSYDDDMPKKEKLPKKEKVSKAVKETVEKVTKKKRRGAK